MTARGDARLRDAQRLAASGSPADRAALLVARLRVAPGCETCGGRAWQLLSHGRGGLPAPHSCVACAGTGTPFRARVELAAYCSDESARGALGYGPMSMRSVVGAVECPTTDTPLVEIAYVYTLPSWLRGLSRWADIGPVPGWVLVRAGAAAARVALPVWEASLGWTWSGGRLLFQGVAGEDVDATLDRGIDVRVGAPRRAIDAADAWLACPCEGHRIAACVTLLDAMPTEGGNGRAWLPCPPNRPTGGWGLETVGVWPSTADTAEWNTRAVSLSARLAGEPAVRAAIQEALVSWSLGQAS